MIHLSGYMDGAAGYRPMGMLTPDNVKYSRVFFKHATPPPPSIINEQFLISLHIDMIPERPNALMH